MVRNGLEISSLDMQFDLIIDHPSRHARHKIHRLCGISDRSTLYIQLSIQNTEAVVNHTIHFILLVRLSSLF